MKKLCCFLVTIAFSVTISFAQKTDKNKEVFEVVDQKPEYPGGLKAMYAFIGKNLKYPKEAEKANISGSILVKLLIEEDGSISDITFLKTPGFGLDEEVTRVIKAMPRWTPAKKGNQPVSTSFLLPIRVCL